MDLEQHSTQALTAVPHVTTNIIFDSCQFNDTTVMVSNNEIAAALAAVGGTQSLGIEMRLATNATFNNCESNGCSLTLNVALTSGFPPLGTVTTSVQGFNIRFSNNVTFTNCGSSGLHFQNNGGVGVREFTDGIVLTNVNGFNISNCHSYGNTNGYNAESAPSVIPSQLVVEGFDFSSSQNGVVADCTSSGHNQAAANPAEGQFSLVAGFNSHFFECTTCTAIEFRRCAANGNVDTGGFDGFAFGFSTREPQFAGTASGTDSGTYVFESCIAESNTTRSTIQIQDAGFDIFNLVNSKIINCFAEGNNIGINVSDFTASPPATNDIWKR